MESFPLVWVLPIATFVLFIAYAVWGKIKLEKQMDDPDAPKSSLAKDGPSH
jgi:hypothetical protein